MSCKVKKLLVRVESLNFGEKRESYVARILDIVKQIEKLRVGVDAVISDIKTVQSYARIEVETTNKQLIGIYTVYIKNVNFNAENTLFPTPQKRVTTLQHFVHFWKSCQTGP